MLGWLLEGWLFSEWLFSALGVGALRVGRLSTVAVEDEGLLLISLLDKLLLLLEICKGSISLTCGVTDWRACKTFLR